MKHLIKILFALFALSFAHSAHANCTVNGVSYRTNSDTSGTYITLTNLTDRASSWNNTTDLVTTCDVSQFTSMERAFYRNTSFNQDISSWDVSNVTDMDIMFGRATEFNQNIGNWDVSKVTNTYAMFYGSDFNQDISTWDVSNVTNMSLMFYFNTSFNQDISTWDVSNVTDMGYMFYRASSFNQDIRSWDVSNVTDMRHMFRDAYAMISTYGSQSGFGDTPLASWFSGASSDSTAPTISSVSLNAANSELTVTFSESVYDTSGGSGDLEVADFALSISGGAATVTATPASIAKTSASVWVLGLTISGTATGSETLSVVPAGATSIYDVAGNAASTTQTGNSVSLNEKVVPTISSVSIASNNSTTTEGFAGDEVTLTFTADETIGTPTVTFKSGGAAITDTSISYANDSGNTWTATYTVNASDTAGAVTYSIAFSDSAGNAGTAITSGSGSVTIYPTPAVAFAAELTKINAKIASFAQAELNNLSSTMSGISNSARSRFMSKMQGSEVKVSSSAPDYSGGFNASGGKINTNLSITQSSKSPSALYTTYTSYDIFYNKYEDNSLSSGVAGQIQFERLLNDSTMLGYFIGGSVGLMNEAGTLSSSMEAVGIKLGSYFVRELEGNLILDGYASVVTSQNSLPD